MLAGRRIKDPKEGKAVPKHRTVVNIIFDVSTERMREIAFGNQSVNFDKGAENPNVERSKGIEQWVLDVYNFAASKWGEENIAVLHEHPRDGSEAPFNRGVPPCPERRVHLFRVAG